MKGTWQRIRFTDTFFMHEAIVSFFLGPAMPDEVNTVRHNPALNNPLLA